MTKKPSSRAKSFQFDEDAIPKVADNILFRMAEDSTVTVLNIEIEDSYYAIDGLSSKIWLHINGKRSLKKIHDDILKEHQPPEAVFNRDFSNFIDDLMQHKLISL